MLSPKIQNYIFNKPILSIVAFGVIVRLFILLIYQHITIYPDSEGYIGLAQQLSTFNLSGYDGTRSPGYPILLFLANNSLPLTILFQFTLGIATSVYLYKMLKLLGFTLKVALIATLTASCLIHVTFYEAAILTESLTLFFITVIFYILFSGFFTTAGNLKNTLLLSFLLGYLVFIKPFYIFLPFIIYALYVLKGFKISRLINNKIIIFIFPLASFLGWSYVNKVNTGYFVSTTYFGINIAQNCVYFAENTTPEYTEIGSIYAKHREEAIKADKDVAMTIWFARQELMDTTGLSLVDFSHLLSEYSNATIKLNPGGYAKQVFISWKDFWKTAIYWNYHDFKIPYSNKGFLLVWFIQSFFLQILKIGFILLIPYHIIRFFKTRLVTPELIIVTIVFGASILQAMATYGTNSRFSYPFEFLMIITIMLTFKQQLYKLAKIKEN